MAVTVITPGKVVKVTPDVLDANDILEFGAKIIEVEGHAKGTGGSAPGPWSIHGAIGEAARRATGAYSKGGDDSRALRDQAARQLEAAHPELGTTEFAINDHPDVDQARASALMVEAIRPYSVID